MKRSRRPDFRDFNNSTQQEHLAVLEYLDIIKKCGKFGELQISSTEEIEAEIRKDGEAFDNEEFEKFISSDSCYQSHYVAKNHIDKIVFDQYSKMNADFLSVKLRYLKSRGSKKLSDYFRSQALQKLIECKKKAIELAMDWNEFESEFFGK